MGWPESLRTNWSTIVTFGCIVIAAIVEAWQQAASNLPVASNIPRLSDGWHYVPLVLLIIAGLSWFAGRLRKPMSGIPQPQPTQSSTSMVPGIPTLSSLLGQDPKISFDAKLFFARAYYSPLTAETEKNIKIIAQQNSPTDKEAFYARFIGVGAVAYHHETTWWLIFKSQLSLLAELNSRGMIPIADAKKHYDKAVTHYPLTYTNYSFAQWLAYLQSRFLIIKHPSDMVEITHWGRDFLRFIAHWGWDIGARKN